MKKFFYCVVTCTCMGFTNNIVAQEPCEGGDNTTQPSIMVVPVVNLTGDILEIIESRPDYRQVIIEIDNNFKSRGFNTKNFVQHLQNIRREEGINLQKDAQSEMDAVVARAGPDIWVKTELIINERPDKSGAKSLTLTAQAIHRISSSNLASIGLGGGEYRYVADMGMRARQEMAKDGQFEKFLNDLNASFNEVRNQGVSFALSIVCYQPAEVRLDMEIGDDFDELGDFIAEFVRDKSYKSSPQASINSSTKLHWDNIKVPLKIKDGDDCVNYNIKKDFLKPLQKKIGKEWAQQTELGYIYPALFADGIGKWIITLCDSKEDCPRE